MAAMISRSRWRNGRCGTRSLLPPRVHEVT
jgi:hypothetical protein